MTNESNSCGDFFFFVSLRCFTLLFPLRFSTSFISHVLHANQTNDENKNDIAVKRQCINSQFSLACKWKKYFIELNQFQLGQFRGYWLIDLIKLNYKFNDRAMKSNSFLWGTKKTYVSYFSQLSFLFRFISRCLVHAYKAQCRLCECKRACILWCNKAIATFERTVIDDG